MMMKGCACVGRVRTRHGCHPTTGQAVGFSPDLRFSMMTILSLPKPQTSYIDHPGAIATARQLLDATRLLTITGVGGSGTLSASRVN